MFNSISWTQYFSATILLLIIYYAVIALKYFKWEILALAGIKKIADDISVNTSAALSNLKGSIFSENHESYQPKTYLENDMPMLIQSFTDEVAAFVQSTDGTKITKEEIIDPLKIIAAKYPALKNADCRAELEAYVLTQINLRYPVIIHEEDLKDLWDI